MNKVLRYIPAFLLSVIPLIAGAQCSIIATIPGTGCPGGKGFVAAKADTGSIVRWYDQPTGGTLLDTGDTLKIPVVTGPATYYAEAYKPGIQKDDSINTLTPNNGQASAMFDCKPLTDITVTGFNFVPRSSTSYTVKIYYKQGTLVGSETNSSAWTLLATSSTFSATANVLTKVPVSFSQPLNANQTYAFYVNVSGGTLGYTNGTTLGGTLVSNSDIILYQGRGAGGLFSSSLFTVRSFSGTMLYEIKTSCTSSREDVDLTFTPATEIIRQSVTDTTCEGLEADFTIETGEPAVNYRWQIFDNISGMFVDIPSSPFNIFGDSLNISGTPDTLDGAIIRCIAEGECSSDTSASMNLVVNPLPKVTTSPADLQLQQGATATFSVTATGVDLQYRWHAGVHDTFVIINEGGIYSGTKTNTLKVSGVSRPQNEFKFRCEVRGGGNCAAYADTSYAAVLLVEPPESVAGINGENDLKVFPNPVTGNRLMIQHNVMKLKEPRFTITTVTGRFLTSGELDKSGHTGIDVRSYPPGVYILGIADSNGSAGKYKFSKQ